LRGNWTGAVPAPGVEPKLHCGIRMEGSPMLRHAILLTVAVLLNAGCAVAEEATSPGDVEGPFVWGAVPNVTRLSNLWFAGQPDTAGLEVAKQNGVAVVVNMREPGEMRWDEASAVERLGMSYFSVPVSGWRPYSAQAFDRIAEIVEANSEKQILIHCGSSNRVGGWLATQLAQLPQFRGRFRCFSGT